MLPYFHILINENDYKKKMHSNDVPVKPIRKKNSEVPIVHKRNDNKFESKSERSNYKTYSANFNSKKIKHQQLDVTDDIKQLEVGDHSYNIDEHKTKISKKHLLRENERLTLQNNEFATKITLIEDHLNRKNCKLKEKNIALQDLNEAIIKENEELKTQMHVYENELETYKHCRKCDEYGKLLQKTRNEFDALNKSNNENKEDLNMLKNVIYRLNVQLERYQDKLQKNNISITQCVNEVQIPELCENSQIITRENLPENHWDHGHTPISWGKVNTHTLGPLLDAYQDTLNEKDYIIQTYENELARFTSKLKEIMKENEILYKKLNEDKDCSKVLIIDIEKIKHELKNAKEENDLLIKKCALKQNKLDEVLNCYEQKVEQIQRDYNVLYEQYCKNKTEVNTLKEKNKSLADTYEDIKNERQQYIPISVHNSSVNECKKWYEELKQQYELEKHKLMENIQSHNNKITELSSNITILNSDKTELENKLKQSEKIIKKAETKYLDLQHNLNEVQLSRSACRKQLNKAMNFAKDLVTEQESLLKALNQRQQETRAVKKIGSDIANRMDSLKVQLKTVQKDAWQELSFVEQRIKEQNSFIEKLKSDHNEEIDKLKKEIKEKEETNLVLAGNASLPISPYLLFKDKHLHM